MFKRVFSFVICLVMLLSCACLATVGAESTDKAIIKAGDTTCEVNVGDEVIYTVRLYYEEGIEIVSASVKYNPEVLTYVDEGYKAPFPNFDQPLLNHNATKGELAFNAVASSSFSFSENQVLATFKFKVKASGNCDFSLYMNQLYGANRETLAERGMYYDYSAVVTETVSTQAEEMYLEISHHGEIYKAKVGDVITYTLYLETPEKINDLFASVQFSTKYLWPEDADFKDRYPNVIVGSDDLAGNGLQFAGNIRGEGFASGKSEVLAVINFTVKKEGKTAITEGYELFTESGECYMSGFENAGVVFSSDISIKGEEIEYPLLGDANGNGEVNIKDATTIQKATAKLLTLDESTKPRADVNADGKVNVKDATAVQKYIAKIETGFAIGEPMGIE